MAAAAEVTCPTSWLQANDYCYWASNFSVSWWSVATVCRLVSPRSQSVSVHSQTENVAVASLMEDQRAWIGLSRPQDGNFTWSDRSQLDFSFWQQGEPYKGADCGIINYNMVTGEWGSFNCDEQLVFACKQPLNPCPEGWSRLENRCYVYNSTLISPPSHPQQCRQLHFDAEPVSIHSEAQNSFLFTLCGGGAYIGLMRRTASGDYSWRDGSALDYTNWATPPNRDSPFFVVMGAYSRWTFEDSEVVKPFFCQIKI